MDSLSEANTKNMAGDKHFAGNLYRRAGPVENRMAQKVRGWKVTVSALANERSIGEVTQQPKLDELKDLVKSTRVQGKPAAEDPAVDVSWPGLKPKRHEIQRPQVPDETNQRGALSSQKLLVNKLHRASFGD